MPLRVLIVDDNPDDREALQRALSGMPEIDSPASEALDAGTCQAALEAETSFDCILLDYSLPGRDGLKVLGEIIEQDPMAAVVMITGQGDQAIAVEAMKVGAQDYLTKELISPASLARAIANATERSRMQRMIRNQQESLQSFAQVIVHDLRAPLRSIQQAIGMLNEDLPKDVAAENSEMLDFVVQGAHRMDALIVALKSYTEVDATPPSFEPVDLRVLVEHTCSDLAATIADNGATVTCEPRLPAIFGNPPQLAQLLQNLIGNGIKYNRSDKPEVLISSSESNDSWMIGITDNGIGIEPAFLQKIFEPFQRLHADTEFEGTGLGLATCKKIAERHGGSLSCKSEVGKGSVFTLLIPKRRCCE